MKTITLLSAALVAITLSGEVNAELTSREIGWCVQSKEFASKVTQIKVAGAQKAELHKGMREVGQTYGGIDMTITHGIINLVYDHASTPDEVFNSCMRVFSKD